jgi:hypothetical protein
MKLGSLQDVVYRDEIMGIVRMTVQRGTYFGLLNDRHFLRLAGNVPGECVETHGVANGGWLSEPKGEIG